MRKLIALLLTLALFAGLAVPALAYDYSFNSGPDSGATFGKSTGYDEPVTGNPLGTNERRNKDAALLPPSYGVFSGDIPTDPSSLYHDNLPGRQRDAAPNLPRGGDEGIVYSNSGSYGFDLPGFPPLASIECPRKLWKP